MATRTITSSTTLAAFGANPGSSGGYDADDDIVIPAGMTLTVDATPTKRVRSIAGLFPTSKLQVTNTSTANMLKLSFSPGGLGAVTSGIASLRFENGAEVNFQGNYIQIYTGDGTANQTVLSNLTIGGQKIDIPTFVEVETGSGTGVYEKWMVVPERVTNYEQSQYGYNARYPQTGTGAGGTVAITSGGVVTLTGGTFVSSAALLNKRFRAAGHATDYLISAYTSTTSITLSNADGTTYTGGAIGAGATYQIRCGSVFERDDFSAGDFGTVLFLDSFGGNALGSAQALKAGDGTYGRVIPNGAKVRVPNIYVGCDLASTTLAAAITGTTAAAITLTSGANFPSTNTPWNNNSSQAGTLLVYDPATGKGERIGYTTIAASVVSATGMTRGAYNSVAQTFPIGATVYFIPHETIAQGNGYFDLQSGGKLVADKVMFGYNFGLCPVNSTVGLVGAKSISITNSGTILGLSFPNASFVAGNCTFDNVSFTPDMRNPGAPGVYVVNFQGVSGNLTLKNIFVVGSNDFNENGGGQAGHFQVQQCFNISEITNIKSWAVRPTGGGTTNAFLMTGCGATTVTNLRVAGQINLNYIDGTIFDQIYTAGNCSTAWVTLQGNNCINASVQVLNCIFRGLQNYETVPIAAGRPLDFSPTTQGNIVHNKGYPTFNFRNRGSATNAYVADTGTRNTFAYFDFINCRDNSLPILTNSQNPGQRIIKITSDQYNATILTSGQGPGMAYQGYRDIIFGPQINSTAAYNLDVNPYTVMTDSTGSGSGGYLCFGPLQPEDTYTNTYTGLGTTAYLNGTGQLAITTTGDTVTVKSQYAQKGISSFNTAGSITIIGNTSGTVTAGAFNGVTYEFRMVNWGDDITVPAWQSLTLANLETTRAALSGYSTSVGINMQMRMTATTTVAARTVTLLRMPITWDTAYTPEVGTWNLDVTNVLTGSTVALSLDNGTTWSQIKTAASSTVTLPVTSNWTGSTINYKLRVRKAGYEPIEISGSTKDDVAIVGATGLSIRVDQAQILDANGAPVYGNGTTSALVSLDYAALRIDIGNGSVSGPDLYDTVTNNAVNSTGIKYAWPISSPGLAGGFDVTVENTWKLRRKLVTDTNAAISKFVLYGPNPALSPVDTVNGTVALSHTFTMTVSGLLTGSAVALSTNGGASWSTATAAGTSVTFPLVFTTYGGTINYTLRVRKAGYDSIESSGSVVYADITIPVTQAQTLDANGQPIYGNGTTSALVSIDAAALRIDIGNGSVNGPDLYDTVTAWACGTTGIQYVYPISSPGLAGYFDCTVENTWKLRRKLVTDTNAAISVFVLYGPNPALSPVDTVNGSVALSHTFTLAVTGSLSGSVLAMSLDGGSTWTTATSTGATVNFSVVFTTYGGTKNYIVRVRKAGYTPLEYSGSLVYQSGSVPSAQVQVVDINGVAVYGRGPGTTTAYINIVPGSLRVDIGNILVVGEDLYDYIAAWEATTTGIQYPEVLQFNGTDSIILNSFKLRRNVAGSTNAMIDMIVFYGPNTALNPVDEANGSVQLFPRVVRQGSLSTLGAAVWDYQTSSATTSGSMGARLKDASTVATNGQQLTAALS